MSPTFRLFLPAAVFSFAICGTPSEAAVVGHWRFENSTSLGDDSGANDLDLVNSGAASVSTVFPTPLGAGSNNLAINLEADSTQFLSSVDDAAFAFQEFTIESFVQLESKGSGGTPRIIASQLNTSTGVSVGWQFGIAGQTSGLGDSRLFMQMSSNGSTIFAIRPATGFQLEVGVSYYAAASVDFTATTTEVTFYLQDLTGTNLQSTTVSSSDLNSLFDSTADFAIGASHTSGTASRHWDGLIDEVRLSNTARSSTELLVIPEPAAGLLLLGGLALSSLRRRRVNQ